MKVQELINYVDKSNLYSLWDFEESMTDEKFDELKKVAEGLEIDKHRWYEVSTTVYKVEDGYVGVRGVYQIYSEYMSDKDCDYLCEASEYEEVQTISYRVKQNK